MLRVTPIYGSLWSPEGQAEEPTCTLVEYGGCRILVNVGWVHTDNHAATITSSSSETTTQLQQQPPPVPVSYREFPRLPDHDCLLLTDSTLQSIGGLPLYYHQQQERLRRGGRRRRRRRRRPSTMMMPVAPESQSSAAVIQGDSDVDEEDDDDNNPEDKEDEHVPDDDDEEEEEEETRLETTTSMRSQQQQQQSPQSKQPPPPMPPIYATFPIVKMGQMTLYDHHANISLDGGCPPYTLSQIDDAIAAIQCIKYSQPILLGPRNNHSTGTNNNIPLTTLLSSTITTTTTTTNATPPTISMTAHRAGHCIGGSFFLLQRLQDEATVVVTKTYNIGKELHLDSSTLLKHASTPDVLITYPGGPAWAPLKAFTDSSSSSTSAKPTSTGGPTTPSRFLVTTSHQVERQLTESILSVLRRNGNVLLPVDAASRCLELILLLQSHWHRHRFKAAYNLVWLGPMVPNTMEFAKAQSEWMASSTTTTTTMSSSSKGGGNNNSNNNAGGGGGTGGESSQPNDSTNRGSSSRSTGGMESSTSLFLFQTVQFCSSVREVEQLMQQNPTCVLATGLTLEHGPARNLLLLLADNPDNAIIFTDSSQAYLRRRRLSRRSNHDRNKKHVPSSPSIIAPEKNTSERQTRNTTVSLLDPVTASEKPAFTRNDTDNHDGNNNKMEGEGAEPNNSDSMDKKVVQGETPTAPVTTTNTTTVKEDDTGGGGDDDEDEDGATMGVLGSTTTSGLMSSGSKVVVLTNPSQEASPWNVTAQLLRAWAKAKANQQEEMEDSIWIDLPVPKRVPLSGNELKAFWAAEEEARLRRIKEQQQQAMLREVELAKGQLRLGEEDGGTGGTTTTVDHGTTTTSSTAAASSSSKTGVVVTGNRIAATTTAGVRPRKKSRFDQSLFLKFSKPLHLCFEVREEAVGIGQHDSIAKFGIGESIGRSGEVLEDDYGIAVRHDHFTDIVSGVDPSKFGASGRVGEDVLKRGFGYSGGGSSSTNTGGGAKVISDDEGPGGGMGGGDGSDGVAGGGTGDGGSGSGGDSNDQELQEAVDLSEGHGIVRGRNGRPPMKVTTVMCKLEVFAEISYIPGLEGRVDARAARQSVRALQPRQVIVLGGPDTNHTLERAADHNNNNIASTTSNDSKEKGEEERLPLLDAVTLLAEAAQSFLAASSIATTTSGRGPLLWTPSNGETVTLNVGHAAYAVRLVDTPYQTPEDIAAGKPVPDPVEPSYEVKLGACTVSWIDAVATGQKVALDGSLVLAPPTTKKKKRSPSSLYLSSGEVLLTDLRAELMAHPQLRFKAEYSSHKGYAQLVINQGKIIVRKDLNSGRIQVEGPLCQDFWTVREIVTRQYVVL